VRLFVRCVALVLSSALTGAPVVLDACVITCASHAVDGDRADESACHHGAAADNPALSGASSCTHDHSQTASSADDHVTTTKRPRSASAPASMAAATNGAMRLVAVAIAVPISPPPRFPLPSSPTPLRI
jgi:hypothetical protein